MEFCSVDADASASVAVTVFVVVVVVAVTVLFHVALSLDRFHLIEWKLVTVFSLSLFLRIDLFFLHVLLTLAMNSKAKFQREEEIN